ncbi:MAG: DNA methyltransferase [Thermoguttaceae bacterium]
MYQLINADCLKVLKGKMLRETHWDTIVADPPDNIGLGYNHYKDKMPDDVYTTILGEWLYTFVEHADTVWFSFNARWTFAVGKIFDRLLATFTDIEGKPCVQTFTFGQHSHSDLGNNHRPLWRLRWKTAPLFPDAIRVPSWRQLNGDKRADSRGRVPGDVLHYEQIEPAVLKLRLEDIVAITQSSDTAAKLAKQYGVSAKVIDGLRDGQINDVFDFTRVTGNSKQRRSWHPTQLNEGLVERCIKFTTPAGGRVLDPFGGTGTTLRACKRLNLPCTLIELDPFYCSKIVEEHQLAPSSAGDTPTWEAE